MYTLLIVLAVGFLISEILYRKDPPPKSNRSSYMFYGGVVAGFIGILIAMMVPGKFEYVPYKEHKLVSFQDNFSVQGDFFLGCGSVDEKISYFFYYQLDDGKSFASSNVPYDETIIRYENKNPRIEVFLVTNTRTKWSFAPPKFRFANVVYVPEGTIKNSYNLDLQ